MKKTISLILSAAIIAANAVIPLNAALADTEELTQIMHEDFESYELTYDPDNSLDKPVNAKGEDFVGDWMITCLGEELDTRAKAYVANSPGADGKSLRMSTFFVYNWYSGHPAMTPKSVSFEDGNKYNFKFDFYRSADDDCVGLRFYDTSDMSWKALYFAGRGNEFTYENFTSTRTRYSTVVLEGSSTDAWRVKNSTEVTSPDDNFVTITQAGSSATTGRNLYYVPNLGGAWYTVEADVEEGIMSWTVKNRDSGSLVQTGRYSSAENIINPTSRVELFAGGANSHYAYFDNFEINRYTNYVPMRACINLIEAQRISSSNTIRFNQLNGGYVAGINSAALASQTVGLSSDGVNFTDVTLDENGVWSSGRDEQRYTHIKLPVSDVPSDLKVFGDIERGGCDLMYRTPFGVYAVSDGVNTGMMMSGEITDDSVAAFSGGIITGLANNGQTDVKFTSPERKMRTAEVRVIDELSLLEAAGDTESIANYVSRQQPVLDVLNTAIANGDKAAADTFFSSSADTGVLNAITCIDGAVYRELKASSPEKFDRFTERILSYTDGFHCQSTVAEIRAVEDTFKKEVATGNIENLSSAAEVIAALEANNKDLKLNLDSFYTEYKNDICGALVSVQFVNYARLEKMLSDNTVLVTTEKCINPSLIVKLIEDYESTIGYNKAHYDTIGNKTAFGNAYAAAKNNLTDIDKIKAFIDSYTPAAAPTPKPTVTPGGGGGGGHVTSYVDTKDKNENPKASPAVKPAVEKKEIYPDVPLDYWGYEAIRFLNARNAVDGYDDGTFMPGNGITRAEFAKILVNAFDNTAELAEDYVTPFTDLAEDAWYYEAMSRAEILGIIKGVDGMCRPNDKITRQELAVMTYRMIEAIGKSLNRNTDAEKFADEAEIADWAKTVVLKMQVAGIINGTDGKFMPQSETTRAMAAQILYKTMQGFEEVKEEAANEE